MCLGIYIPKKQEVSATRLYDGYIANPDGCGILWATNNELFSLKGHWDWNFFVSQYNLVRREFPDSSLVIHFRTASASGIGQEFCHPHFVNPDLAFIHNGNFFEFSSYFGEGRNDGKSDTQRFNEEILQKLPKGFLYNETIIATLQEYCYYNSSKLIFMNSRGDINMFNSQHGEWKNNCWFSNRGIENYAGYGYSGAYKYKKDEVRHKGGLPTVQMFSEERRKNWERCDICLGYYTKNSFDGVYCNSCHGYLRLKEFCR